MNTLSDYSAEKINDLIQTATEFAQGKTVKAQQDIFVSNLFFEDSTRTKTSFLMAEEKLGLRVIPFDVSTSSVNKGESLYDTVKTLESIGVDLAVIRHSKERFYDELSGMDIRIVNGGDGTGNHPSQSLLDLMTIKQEFGRFAGLKVGIVGDVKHSRVANSNAEALRMLGARVYFSGPEEWFEEGTLVNGTYQSLDSLVKEVDVLMLLRIQHERHSNKMTLKKADYLNRFGLTKQRASTLQDHAIIMHPAPINRGVEIDSDLVESPKSRIFKQMQNGVFARMAILKDELEQKGFTFK